MKNIIIFGGTFNPIHKGHTYCAKRSLEYLNAKKVIFVPANIPPHKNMGYWDISPKDRFDMCNLAVNGISEFEVSDFEIKQPGISYTVFTLEYFKSKFFGMQIYLLVGEDMLFTLDKWKNYKKIFSLANICVAYRNIEKIYNKVSYLKRLKEDGANVVFIENSIVDVSSTEIRNKIHNNEDITGLTYDSVIKYIKCNKLYL